LPTPSLFFTATSPTAGYPLSLHDALPISVWVDARRVLVTDDEFTAAVPDMNATCRKVAEIVAPEVAAGRVPVMGGFIGSTADGRSEEHTSELQSRENLVCRLLLEKKKNER